MSKQYKSFCIGWLFSFCLTTHASQQLSSPPKPNNVYVVAKPPPVTSQEYLHIMNHAHTKPFTIPQDLYDALYQAQQQGAEKSSDICLIALMKLMPHHGATLHHIKIMEQLINK